MSQHDPEDIFGEAAEVAEERFAKLELEAARDLIRNAFEFLPWELQEGYQRVLELYSQGRRSEAGAAWQEWMATAREMGLI